MDEVSMTRRLLAETPPEPHVVAKGRARLVAAATHGGRTTRIARPTPTTRRAVFPRLVGVGLVGMLIAAVLAVAILVPGESRSPGGGGSPTADGSARDVLLAAAVRAESVPTSGAYWHVRSTSTTTVQRKLGRGDNRYTVELRAVTELWTNRNGQTWWGLREWVRPKSPEDVAAWRRDGSPSEWCMGNTDTEPPQSNCLRTEPGTASLTRVGKDTFEIVEGRDLTFAQIQRLPDEPEALRVWVVDAVGDDLDPTASAEILDDNVAAVLANLLVDVPVPPGVRAAAYRALADMPNVRSIGATRDELGRAGVGILIDTSGIVVTGGGGYKAGEVARKLIIDSDTSHVLASETNVGESSDPFSGTLVLEIGWTDQEPHEPALP